MRATLVLLWALFVLSTFSFAQQPAKPPALPPINPAAARLDQTITGLDGPGFGIAYSADLDMLVASCEHATIQSWKKDVLLSIRTGSGSAGVLRGHEGPVLAMAWNGGPVLASTATDRKLLLWSIAEGKVLHTVDLDRLVRTLAMSPDGKLLASAGADNAIKIWDFEKGEQARTITGHGKQVTRLLFAQKAGTFVTCSGDQTVRMWNTGGGTVRNFGSNSDYMYAVAVSPDAAVVVAGGEEGVVRLYNGTNGQLIKGLLPPGVEAPPPKK
jgi:WD40 repeat protein